MTNWTLGIIGGSGLYQVPGIEGGRWETITSPWGVPSDQVFRGKLNGIEVVFLPRHGRGHRLGPTQLNYRANVDVMKRAGVTDIVSLSACGSLKEEMAPGDFVVVDQFIDRTFAREKSFFGEGVVAHVSMAHPVSSRLAGMAAEESEALGVKTHRGGTYLAMEGPQFSSLADSSVAPFSRKAKSSHAAAMQIPGAAQAADLPFNGAGPSLYIGAGVAQAVAFGIGQHSGHARGLGAAQGFRRLAEKAL